jgi:hypothetical protein
VSEAPASFLRQLGAFVVSDPGPPGFAGTVAVGVAGEHGLWWWVGRFHGASVTGEFVQRLPSGKEVDAVMLFEGAPESAATKRVTLGDATLLELFGRRYLQRQTALDVRLTHSDGRG